MKTGLIGYEGFGIGFGRQIKNSIGSLASSIGSALISHYSEQPKLNLGVEIGSTGWFIRKSEDGSIFIWNTITNQKIDIDGETDFANISIGHATVEDEIVDMEFYCTVTPKEGEPFIYNLRAHKKIEAYV